MRERRNIVELWKRGDAAALVTLVRVEGSSYRRVGARLLIARNGDYAGAISGGCLEAEVIRKAAWKVRDGAAVDRYSTLFDDTAEIPYGLGCGGTVDLLLEPAGTPEFTALMQALERTLRGESLRVRTQLPQPGVSLAREILGAGGGMEYRSAAVLREDAATFEEALEPPQRLVIFGAGDDAQPMVRCAALLGWRVVVADSRAQWARAVRFPEAERVLTSIGEAAPGAHDAVIIMTHSYEQDRACLIATLPVGPRYVGLLGARHRSALLLSEAAATLRWELAQVCERVFAPLGLDLGGDGAEVIALAAIAEVQAALSDKLPALRHMSPEQVRVQVERGGAAMYLQPQCAL